MKKLLIASFSPLRRDPRLLRQIKLFSENGYRVTTMGYGEKPDFADEHVEINKDGQFSFPQKVRRLLTLQFGSAARRYSTYVWYGWALRWVQDHAQNFDVIFTNDVLAAPLGQAAGIPWHADLHEFALDQGTSKRWKRRVLPMIKWATPMLTQADSTSTVAPGIAAKYTELNGIEPFVVNNAPNYRPDFAPTPTGDVVRLVHMGAGARERSLEMPIRAAIAANQKKPGSLTLDYYLVPGDAAHIEELRSLAATPGSGVTMQDPVQYEEILPTLRRYDAALAFFPPTTTNLKHTLPNKFFEAVQARIGVISGPSPEMGPYIHEYGFGETTTAWTQASLNKVFLELTPKKIDQWKSATQTAAPKLGAEHQDKKWLDAVNKLSNEER